MALKKDSFFIRFSINRLIIHPEQHIGKLPRRHRDGRQVSFPVKISHIKSPFFHNQQRIPARRQCHPEGAVLFRLNFFYGLFIDF